MDAGQVHVEVKRLGTADYPNPARTRIAYMLALLMCGYTHLTEPVTINMPHYTVYAPHVTNKDIGGNGFGQLPSSSA